MLSMKTEFSTLFYELGTLRAKTVVSSDYDAILAIKCHSVERERDELRSMFVEVGNQLGTAQYDASDLTITCSATREDEKVRLKQERAVLF